VVHADSPSVLRAQAGAVDELAVLDGTRVLARSADDGGTQIISDFGIDAGDTFLRLRGRPSEDLYKLTTEVWLDDGSIEREPNDKEPQPLSLPIALTGHIWPRRDVDLFGFHVAAGHAPVSVTVEPPRGVPIQLRLLQVHGKALEVIGATSAQPPALISVPVPEGDYIVELSSREASASEPYELHVSP
jgi:hypothetical protein